MTITRANTLWTMESARNMFRRLALSYATAFDRGNVAAIMTVDCCLNHWDCVALSALSRWSSRWLIPISQFAMQIYSNEIWISGQRCFCAGLESWRNKRWQAVAASSLCRPLLTITQTPRHTFHTALRNCFGLGLREYGNKRRIKKLSKTGREPFGNWFIRSDLHFHLKTVEFNVSKWNSSVSWGLSLRSQPSFRHRIKA